MGVLQSLPQRQDVDLSLSLSLLSCLGGVDLKQDGRHQKEDAELEGRN